MSRRATRDWLTAAMVLTWGLDPAVRHLNHGSFGAVPTAALAAQSRYRDLMEGAPVKWFVGVPQRIREARHRVAPYLGVSGDDLAFVPNASAGASVVFASLRAEPGDEVVVTDHGYGAVTMGAQRFARRWGCTVRTAHVPLAADPAEAAHAITAQFSERTTLVVVDHVTSPTGRFLPVDLVGAAARDRGIRVLVDGAHVPLMLAEPLAGLDCDVWVGNLHKFGCAPRGSGVLVARGPVRDELQPLIDSWGAGEPFPASFDQQGTLDFTSWLAAPDALDAVESEIGWKVVRDDAADLVQRGAGLVAEAFAELTGEDHRVDVGTPAVPFRLVRLPGRLGLGQGGPNAVRDRVLDGFDVEAAFTAFDGEGFVRLSAHAYNTLDDYADFADRVVPALVRWARDS
ncbi:aminotransferase class V-fold PLP-dependent enzyme [Kineococcus rhizosphaerae]|uniref:Isopenicillin-N epimerase n=1 Tax=Kineococcus rhizosphaerae TaxID=559628 RepID=A0A2T0R312_9ACTN|nr:aminotransferase class V-fold PLP-dependent enzyme [Kineococcus rhizosphaerae]PRY14186.1 isopenicillin-N epimerase [Kineococcus rhizosphaerae]